MLAMKTWDDPKLQAERAHLREDYLRFMGAMANRPVKIKMYENIKITGVFKGADPSGQKIFVKDAHVPVGGVSPAAILRAFDVISIAFCNIKE